MCIPKYIHIIYIYTYRGICIYETPSRKHWGGLLVVDQGANPAQSSVRFGFASVPHPLPGLLFPASRSDPVRYLMVPQTAAEERPSDII